MAGVHGDQLAYFTELFSSYEVFTMVPKIGGGFISKTPVAIVWAYLSRNKGGKEGVVTELRTENQQATFWCEEDIPKGTIAQGMYVADDGELYQFILDNAFTREGGFARHTLQLVTGNNGSQPPHTDVNLGLDEYK
jgi:hypothetical protein